MIKMMINLIKLLISTNSKSNNQKLEKNVFSSYQQLKKMKLSSNQSNNQNNENNQSIYEISSHNQQPSKTTFFQSSDFENNEIPFLGLESILEIIE